MAGKELQQWNAPVDYPEPNYLMGFQIDGKDIPDPSAFSGSESDLDTMGERDATGYLHRDMVATKYPVKMEYRNIPWVMITKICGMLRKEKFSFTFPDPFNNCMSTVEAYAGDREFEAVWASEFSAWIGTLKFSVIQY